MIANEKYYFDLLSQFYSKATKNHPKRLFLIQKSKGNLRKIAESRQKSATSSKKFIATSQEKVVSGSTLGRSRGKSVESDRESTDSRISHKRHKIDEYFHCQFIYESSSFVKTLIYGYLFLTASLEYVEVLVYLREKFKQEYSRDFEESQMKRLLFYLNKIILSCTKKEKYWEKSFMSSFKHLPMEFCNKLFEMTVKMKSDQLQLSNITTSTLKKISQSLGYGINFYHVSKKFIRSEIKQGQDIKLNLSLVYVQELEKWILSDRPLQKPSQDQSVQKIKQIMGENIAKLLDKYEKGNQTFEKLAKILNDQPSRSTQNKTFQTEIRRNNKIISLKVT